MYLQVLGGSALLHLLAAHPRVVAVFGLGLTAAMLAGPLGPGRHVGTAGHLTRIEAAIRPQLEITEAREAAARQSAARILARKEPGEIPAIVAETLRRCGSGCTDISTERITSDAVLLRDVLVLHELDEAVRASRENRVTAPPTPELKSVGAAARR
jgi:hypothetical protein